MFVLYEFDDPPRSVIGKLINPPKKALSEPKLLPRPKHPLVEKIMKLPPHRRVEFFQRFDAAELLNVIKRVLIIMFINIRLLLKEYYEAIKITIALRDKNLTDEERDIIIFGNLETADERLGRIRQPDGTVSYKSLNRNL